VERNKLPHLALGAVVGPIRLLLAAIVAPLSPFILVESRAPRLHFPPFTWRREDDPQVGCREEEVDDEEGHLLLTGMSEW